MKRKQRKRRREENNYHTYSAMILSVESVRLRLMRSERRDMASEAEDKAGAKEREREALK